MEHLPTRKKINKNALKSLKVVCRMYVNGTANDIIPRTLSILRYRSFFHQYHIIAYTKTARPSKKASMGITGSRAISLTRFQPVLFCVYRVW